MMRPRGAPLTPRELEVLKLIASGFSSKEIGSALGIKFKTVVCHRTRVMEKLDMHGTAELTRYAVHHGLVPEDVTEEDRLRRTMRSTHSHYMDALQKYNEFLEERKSIGLENPDSSERTRQLRRQEHQAHEAYETALENWSTQVLGPRHVKRTAKKD